MITLEFPHLERLIKENQFDTIYHEHFSYFSLVTIDRLATRHGLRVFDVEQLATHGGSLRVYFVVRTPRTAVICGRGAACARTQIGFESDETYARFSKQVHQTKAPTFVLPDSMQGDRARGSVDMAPPAKAILFSTTVALARIFSISRSTETPTSTVALRQECIFRSIRSRP